MKNNKNVSLNLAQSINIKTMSSPTNKKVQGFDKNNPSSTFASKVDRLKQKPKQEILQDQYIKGLQDQIKFLQMQLKLLQEKDMQKHGQIDQLEKFFGDGIPINENILAMKNGFNNYKSNNQKKFKDLSNQKQERIILIQSLAIKVQKLLEQLNLNEKKKRLSQQNDNNQWYQLIRKQAGLRKTIEKQEECLKLLKVDNRKLHENIEKMARNKMIQNMSIIKYENNKNTKLNTLKDSISQKQQELIILQRQYLKMKKQAQEKVYMIRLQQENLQQRKKIIILQRQEDNIKNKIKEKGVQLQQKLKQRMIEIGCKRDIQNKVNALKDNINKANSLTVEEASRQAKQQEIAYLKLILDNNKKLIKYTDYYSGILSHSQNQIEALAMRKPQAKSQIVSYNSEVSQLKKRLDEQKLRQINLHSQLLQVQQKFNLSTNAINPLQQHAKKSKQQIFSYLQERNRLMQQIKIKEKQLQLIFILKGLSFEQAQISKSSNNNLQEELHSFIKNWQKIAKNQ